MKDVILIIVLLPLALWGIAWLVALTCYGIALFKNKYFHPEDIAARQIKASSKNHEQDC